MKPYTLLMIGMALCITACAEKEQPKAVQEDSQRAVGEQTAAESSAGLRDEQGSAAFIRHMHTHARQLERLNAALEAEDLLAAQTPAYWLSRHESVSAPSDSWQPYIEQMRDAARAVTNAPDVATARVAAGRIADGCRGCHSEEGVEVPGLGAS